MQVKIKKVLYWLSIVRPIADILIGTWKGIQAVLSNEKLANDKLYMAEMHPDDPEKRPEGMTDSEYIDYFFNKKGKNNG